YWYLFVLVLLRLCSSWTVCRTCIWPRFQDKHINDGMTKYQCDDVIKEKEINKINSLCKDRNTFIITTSLQTVKDICGDEGQKYIDPNKPEANNLKKSKKPFEIVDCNLKTLNAKYPDCQYDGTLVKKAYIVVACEPRGFPYHLVRVIPQK
uniref:Ribonuclease A-domain domain-containing protein n=1 Tax=Sander lucioperca TaxID=283035 RepID=A0A8C9XEX7_SANLU